MISVAVLVAPARAEAVVKALPSGVEMSCNILQDNSLEVQGSNSTAKSFDCEVTCNLKTPAGATASFECTPNLPAQTNNGSLCKSTGPFAQITGGKYSCK
jgi:hypothetical protein